MTDHTLGALNHERENIRQNLIRSLQSLATLANYIREKAEVSPAPDPERTHTPVDTDIRWWADHSQGIVHSATEADRLLNRLHAQDLAIRTVQEARKYAGQADEPARAALRRLLDYAGPDEETDFEQQDELGQSNHIWKDIVTLDAWLGERS